MTNSSAQGGRFLKITSLLAALALTAAACGSDSDTATDAGDTETTEAGTETTDAEESGDDADAGADMSELSGSVFISGSSTVEPISIRVAESFESVAPDVIVDVEGPGTGDGFKKFCEGESDISDASRPIKDEEAEVCAEAGIEFIELRVAIDGISVVTSPENEAVACLNFVDLYALVGPESEGFSKWSDGQTIATELGSDTVLPDADLLVTAPGAESGTYDSFIEIVLEDSAETREQEATTRTDYSSSADDNTIVSNVAANPTSFGWVGFAFADLNRDSLKLIPIASEPGGDCIDPTVETIASGEYPISRSLYIYVSKNKLAENPALAAYVDHYVTVGLDESAAEADYVELGDDAKAETRAAWDAGR